MDSERAVDISNNPKIRVHLSNVVQKGQENYELLQVRRSRIPEESFPLAFPFISMAGDKKKTLSPRSTQFEVSHLYVVYTLIDFVRIYRYF